MPAKSNVTQITDRTLLPRSLIKRPRAPQGAEQQWIIDGWKHLVGQMEFLAEQGAPSTEECRTVAALDGMRAVCASTRPNRPEVAVLQMCIAIGELDAFCANWLACPEGDEMITMIKSLISNALMGVEDATGISRTEIGGDYIAGRRAAAN